MFWIISFDCYKYYLLWRYWPHNTRLSPSQSSVGLWLINFWQQRNVNRATWWHRHWKNPFLDVSTWLWSTTVSTHDIATRLHFLLLTCRGACEGVQKSVGTRSLENYILEELMNYNFVLHSQSHCASFSLMVLNWFSIDRILFFKKNIMMFLPRFKKKM